MLVILVRHAIAEEKEVVSGKVAGDGQRRLTRKGIDKQKKTSRFLKRHFNKVDAIFSSPLVRARQTAELIKHEITGAPLILSKHLGPAREPKTTLAWLKKNAAGMKKVILVGHEPHLSRFSCFLVGNCSASFIRLKKSGVLIVEINELQSFNAGEAWLLGLYSAGVF